MINKRDVLMDVYAVMVTDMHTQETNTRLFTTEEKARTEYYKIVGNILMTYLHTYMDAKNTPYIDHENAAFFFEGSVFECENAYKLTIQDKIIEMTKMSIE